MDLDLGDLDKRSNAARQIKQRMKFYTAFGRPEARPWEKWAAQIEGRWIQGIYSFIQLQPEIFVNVKLARIADEHLGKIAIDKPITVFVGVGQCAARGFKFSAHMMEFHLQGLQTQYRVAKTIAICQLRKRHTQELLIAGEQADVVVFAFALDA